MMTSSNGNIFRATSPLCGEFTGPGEFPTQRPVTRSFVFFDLRLNKPLSKQPWGWWFETLSAHHDVIVMVNHVVLITTYFLCTFRPPCEMLSNIDERYWNIQKPVSIKVIIFLMWMSLNSPIIDVSFGSSNGLAPSRQQAVIWTATNRIWLLYRSTLVE